MIERSTVFRRDYRRELKEKHAKALSELLAAILELLEAGKPLPPEMMDHPLKGNYKGYRDCHILNDLVLIYKISYSLGEGGEVTVHLARLGSHSELF